MITSASATDFAQSRAALLLVQWRGNTINVFAIDRRNQWEQLLNNNHSKT
jgi:hypothetical protein